VIAVIGLIFFGVVLVSLLVAPVIGVDSRDGNDWIEHRVV
jgi:hypothetical protein